MWFYGLDSALVHAVWSFCGKLLNCSFIHVVLFILSDNLIRKFFLFIKTGIATII